MGDEEPALNLIPQWVKRASSSPRHAQAPPPAAPPPPRAAGGNNTSAANSSNQQQATPSKGRFQSFVQNEQHRRTTGPTAQGSFEGGRFTMPSSEGGGRRPPNTKDGSMSNVPNVANNQPPPVTPLPPFFPNSFVNGAPKIQYTKEEILELAIPSTLDMSLLSSELPEGVIASEWLEPELKKQFDTEEIYNAWYDTLQSERRIGGVRPLEGPPRVGDTWRKPPPSVHWQRGDEPQKRDLSSILPPSGGMGLEKMALAAEQFAKEMAATRARGDLSTSTSSPASTPQQLKGLLEVTGNSILDEPLEEGLDRPPEEMIIPQEEAIDFSGDDDQLPAQLAAAAASAVAGAKLEEVQHPAHQQQQAKATQQLPRIPGIASMQGLPNMLSSADPWNVDRNLIEKERMQFPTQYAGLDLLSAGSVFPPSTNLGGAAPPPKSNVSQFPSSSSVVRASSMLPPARTLPGPPAQLFAPSVPPSISMPQNMAPQQVPPPVMVDEWYYMDPQNAIQGPFSSKEMKEWFEAGYFNPDLPISYGHRNGKFFPLAAVYSDLRVAFSAPPRLLQQQQQQQVPPLPNLGANGNLLTSQQQQQFIQQQQQMAAAAAQKQQQQRAYEQQMRQEQLRQEQILQEMERMRREEEMRRDEELRRQEEQIRKEESMRVEEEVRQRKLMEEAKQQHVALPQQTIPAAPATPAWSTNQSNPVMTFAEIRAEEEKMKIEAAKKNKHQQQQQQPSAKTDKPAGSPSTPWGKSSQEPVRAPTLKEIQEAEEEKRKNQKSEPAAPMTMASKIAQAAGIETRTWAGVSESPAKKEAQRPIPSSILAPPPSQQSKPVEPKSVTKPSTASTTSTAATTTTKPATSTTTGTSSSSISKKPVDAPAEMSEEFRGWCVENAPTVGADIALLEFCYDLDNTTEIRETCIGYLGFKPPVEKFVDEFIRRMNLDKGSSKKLSESGSEWTSAKSIPGKAGKKKRG